MINYPKVWDQQECRGCRRDHLVKHFVNSVYFCSFSVFYFCHYTTFRNLNLGPKEWKAWHSGSCLTETDHRSAFSGFPVNLAAPQARPLPPLMHSLTYNMEPGTSSVTGFRAKLPYVQEAAWLIVLLQRSSNTRRSARWRLVQHPDPSTLHSLSESSAVLDSTRSVTQLSVMLDVCQGLVRFNKGCRDEASVRRGVMKNTCASQMLIIEGGFKIKQTLICIKMIMWPQGPQNWTDLLIKFTIKKKEL